MTREPDKTFRPAPDTDDTDIPVADGLELVPPPPDQPREEWGVIIAHPEPGKGGEPKIEARVVMFRDKSRFFVSYPSGKEEVLSPQQFVALILELKRTRRYSFERKRP